jgi:hypothetical protein
MGQRTVTRARHAAPLRRYNSNTGEPASWVPSRPSRASSDEPLPEPDPEPEPLPLPEPEADPEPLPDADPLPEPLPDAEPLPEACARPVSWPSRKAS